MDTLRHAVSHLWNEMISVVSCVTQRAHSVDDNFWVIWSLVGLIYPSEPLDLASPANERICIKVIYCRSETYLAFL